MELHSERRPNKKWIDKGGEIQKSSFKKRLKVDGIIIKKCLY